jgi:hypothetical protein
MHILIDQVTWVYRIINLGDADTGQYMRMWHAHVRLVLCHSELVTLIIWLQ